jgi:hypothetical protein
MTLFFIALSGSIASAADWSEPLRPFLKTHCLACHDAATQKGDLRLDTLTADTSTNETLDAWRLVLKRTRDGEMPPPKKPRPASDELANFVKVIEAELARVERAEQAKSGRVVLRRLNRREYENTLRDLLGVPVDVAELLPEDSLSHGFDTIADSLTLSPVHMERYIEAARKALSASIIKSPRAAARTSTHAFFEGRSGATPTDMKRQADELAKLRVLADGSQVTFAKGQFGNPGPIAQRLRITEPGFYNVVLTASAFQSTQPLTVAFYHAPRASAFGVDIRLLEHSDFAPGAMQSKSYRVWLDPGDGFRLHCISLPLSNYNTAKDGPAADYKGPGIAIQSLSIDGPHYDVWPLRGQQLLFGTDAVVPKGQEKNKFAKREFVSVAPNDDARRLIPGFLTAAFRRPVSAEKAAPYIALFDSLASAGNSYEEAMRGVAVAALCSPDFLFLVESPGPLDDYAIASRLSYMLTRSMPDAELLRLAEAKTLRDPQTLRAQTKRLLATSTAKRFHEDFLDNWLNLRDLAATMPDKVLYPEYDRLLDQSLPMESRAFFAEVLTRNLPTASIIQSDFAMLNNRLAKHYGIEGVEGVHIRRVPLKPEHHRGGMLTQASVMKVSANGTSTSPVLRGVYVLERFLGQTPPPPPPGVPAVEPDIRGAKTVREILAKHREVETCAGCHAKIDPPGFALESYDVIGGYRTAFRVIPANGPRKFKLGLPVDASGEWLGGRKFTGIDEFRAQLAADPDRFTRTMIAKLFAFGTGREPTAADTPEIDRMVARLAKSGHGFRDLVHEVIQSEIFKTK